MYTIVCISGSDLFFLLIKIYFHYYVTSNKHQWYIEKQQMHHMGGRTFMSPWDSYVPSSLLEEGGFLHTIYIIMGGRGISTTPLETYVPTKGREILRTNTLPHLHQLHYSKTITTQGLSRIVNDCPYIYTLPYPVCVLASYTGSNYCTWVSMWGV